MTKKKISTTTTEEMIEMREKLAAKAKALYEQMDKIDDALLKRHGHGYEKVTEIKQDDTTLYKRIRIDDNSELLKQGKPMFKTASFKRVNVSVDILKNKPKEKME